MLYITWYLWLMLCYIAFDYNVEVSVILQVSERATAPYLYWMEYSKQG
jgi:hypothetical protein